MIETERLLLRPMVVEDAESIVRWRTLDRVKEQFFSLEPPTMEQHLKWFEQYQNQSRRREFIIVIKETGMAIGAINLSEIDAWHKSAEYGIYLGEDGFIGQGYAHEASVGILKYGFETLQLHRISLRVFESNQVAIRLYEKLGFKTEGILKDAYFKENRYWDIRFMAILMELNTQGNDR